MPRRLDVELTSAREDGSWTWRAAGAREPKGVLDSSLLYPGAKVGDVVRVEAEIELDGITIISVAPPKQRRTEPEKIELLGPRTPFAPVTMSPMTRPRGRPERPRRDGPPGERSDAPRGDRPDRGSRPARGDRADRGARTGSAERQDRDRRDRRPAREGAPGGVPRRDGRTAQPGRESRDRRPPREQQAAPKPKRLNPGHVHRSAVLEEVPPEQRPIAEAVLRGGIPAVRKAVEDQNAAARAEGRPEIPTDPLVTMAEQLLPRLKAAEWRDRAEAAAKESGDVALRDLRSIVAGADSHARDDESRLLASTLRAALEKQVNDMRDGWINEISACIDDGRLARALRLSARPPDPGIRFPAELAARLTDAASEALAPDVTPDRWGVLLDAVASSPVRRTVKPKGLPSDPGDTLLQQAKQFAGRVPALAPMLGIDMPPPPGPVRRPTPPPPPPPPVLPPPDSGESS